MLPATLRDEFIDLLTDTGNVSDVARRLGINRMTAYGWRDDPWFAQRWDSALEVSRQRLRERVTETAGAMGLGRWVPAIDPLTGDPELDEDFEPVMRFELGHVDARVLMKLMDKTMTEPARRVDQRTWVQGRVGDPADEGLTLVVYGADGRRIDADPEGLQRAGAAEDEEAGHDGPA